MSDDKTTYCYVARQPGCRCIGLVTVDDPEHAKDTAKSIADAVKNGLNIERMTVAEFRVLPKEEGFGCRQRLKMKNCRARGLNKVAA